MYKNTELREKFFKENVCFEELKADIYSAVETISKAIKSGHKLLLAGNGGSAADCLHIEAEFLKNFLIERAVDEKFYSEYIKMFGKDGALLKIQGAMRAVALTSSVPIISAIQNDIGQETVYAQQVYALADKGDVFMGLTTSGNSVSVINAVKTARAKGAFAVALTGRSGGEIAKYTDLTIKAPADETYLIQELHVKLYHFLAAAVETEIFGK